MKNFVNSDLIYDIFNILSSLADFTVNFDPGNNGGEQCIQCILAELKNLPRNFIMIATKTIGPPKKVNFCFPLFGKCFAIVFSSRGSRKTASKQVSVKMASFVRER